ncbi:MAG: type I DNA topoisomerase [Ruminococcaceae bacterium]|nr:type I DNA topoisomerase [Oscillospiraceae bacterium]
MANLVIIESPFKAPAIKNYLGSGYKVFASVGHLRDLPKSSLGVDVENGFEAHYINIRGKGDLIKELKKEAKNANKIFFATDPDREGEAISWHLANVLGIPVEQTRRICFNAITKSAVKEAVKNPRNIDLELVNSQQARRILDRIVGYKLSPFLWKTVRSGLSAGRVQSVVTRAVVDRENEIRAFVPKEYWTVEALLTTEKGSKLTAHFYGKGGDKLELSDRAMADTVLSAVDGKPFHVTSVKKAVRTRNPAPPFTTSTLQQEAFRKLGFQSQRIMRVAQELYEGINLGSANGGTQGLITYMRTDSLRVSPEAQAPAKAHILEKYGDAYCPKTERVYKSKNGAQDAHEAIRPANLELEPDAIKKQLTPDQYKLYKLIYSRFMASQMASAELDTVNLELENNGYIFRASGSTLRFPGFLAVYDDTEEDDEHKKERLPELHEGEALACEKLLPEQHFTEPPARYNEGSLVKFMEEKGIGRPSTYNAIITTILSRGYVEREGKSLKPTQIGEITNDIMVKQFNNIVDYAFTARMEDELDSIAGGETDMVTVLSRFYEGFEKDLALAEKTVSKEEITVPEQETDIICDKCGARMVIRQGRFGKFAACPNYPACKNTKPVDKDGKLVEKTETAEKTGELCEKCGGEMLKRRGRYGEFIACSNYPKCKNTKQILKPVGVPCPKCGAQIVAKNGKNRSFFYSCEKYPECDFLSWDQPTDKTCPDCGAPLYVKKGKQQLVCHEKSCGYKKDLPADEGVR